MYTITVGNLKGGVGKTTSVVNLADSLSRMERKVLVIDADPQANATPFFTKANIQGRTLLDVLKNPDRIRSSIRRSRYQDIDIIKGNGNIREYDALSEFTLSIALDQVADRYDYCLIDTRPAFEMITRNALVTADLFLTPVCLNKFCRDNLALVEEQLAQIQNEIGCTPDWKVFVNMVDAGRRAQRSMQEDLVARHDYPLMSTCISRSAAVDNALDFYKPVSRHRSRSVVVQDYLELAQEIMDMAEGKEE